MKEQKGITMVALVMTIVIMLILVGVTVTASINGGLFQTTRKAAVSTEISQIKEALEEEIIQKKIAKDSIDNITIEDLDIPNNLKEKYKDKLIILNKELYCYDDEVKEEFESIGIDPNSKFFTYNGNSITGLSEDGYTALEKGMTKFIFPSKYVQTDTNGNKQVKTITAIEANAFKSTIEGKENCNKIQKIDLSKTQITTIGNSTFAECTQLKEVILPKTVNWIDSSAFINCKNMEKINLESTKITTVRPYAFYCCKKLKSIEIPDTVIYINERSFESCESLENLKLPNSLEIINFEAFAQNPKIKEIRIPSTVTSIGGNAFAWSASGGKIYVPFTEAEGKPEGWHEQWNRSYATIVYADEVTE